MKKIFLILIFLFNVNNLHAAQSKIVYKIKNEIITNVDIKNEFNYLLALNNELKNLENERIFNIATKSIIREKVKKIELTKAFKDLKIDDQYFKLIIEMMYSNLNLKSLQEFKDYLKTYDVKFSKVKEKVIIDALWNQLIIKKYNSQINIDVEKIKREINSSKTLTSKSYLLSEIVYEIQSKEEINAKYNVIKKSIKEVGFANTVLIYSVSDSSSRSGKIGWVNDKSLSKLIMDNISNIAINEISRPIKISGGVLILKLDDIREDQIEVNAEEELKKIINYQKSEQLNQYSKIYFNKLKKNLDINE
ncbi:peptidylprolyl isomerase [Candidatus Pelagibacter sp.]|jgi:peptidyl-prolyl cis-trans isomerase SurA|nr:peptidylprolyl isomerase [Candidatus Pelagibacter sp.]